MPATPITPFIYYPLPQELTNDFVVDQYIRKINTHHIQIADGEYLSDKASTIVPMLKENEFTMLVSDTGMGKSTFAINHLLKNPNFNNAIIVMPLTMIQNEFATKMAKDLNLVVSHTSEDLDLIQLNGKRKVTVTTYHNFAKYYDTLAPHSKPDLIVWDEIHWLVSYAWLDQLTAKLLEIITQASGNCTMVALTATPGPLLSFIQWFYIDKVIFAHYPELRVPPKQIIVYKGEQTISKLDMVKHYILQNKLDLQNGNKLMIVMEKGIQHRDLQLYNQNLLDKTLPSGCFGNPPGFESHLVKGIETFVKNENLHLQISWTKSQNKTTNSTVQQILTNERFDDETDIFIATIFISNGVNIHDERVKHILVLSDKPDLIKQTAARLRIPNNTNLVLFCRNGDIPHSILNSLPNETEFHQEIIRRSLEKYTYNGNIENFYSYYDNKVVFNVSRAVNLWYTYQQQRLFNNVEHIMNHLFPNVEIKIVDEEYKTSKYVNVKKMKKTMGWNWKGSPTPKQFAEYYEFVDVCSTEEKLRNGCGKMAFEKGLEKLGLGMDEIIYTTYWNSNKHQTYKLIDKNKKKELPHFTF